MDMLILPGLWPERSESSDGAVDLVDCLYVELLVIVGAEETIGGRGRETVIGLAVEGASVIVSSTRGITRAAWAMLDMSDICAALSVAVKAKYKIVPFSMTIFSGENVKVSLDPAGFGITLETFTEVEVVKFARRSVGRVLILKS